MNVYTTIANAYWRCLCCNGSGFTHGKGYDRRRGCYYPRTFLCQGCDGTGFRWQWLIRFTFWRCRVQPFAHLRQPRERCAVCGRLTRLFWWYLPGECGEDCLPF